MVRAVGLPAGVFDGILPGAVAAWSAPAAVESPSCLRGHGEAVRSVLRPA